VEYGDCLTRPPPAESLEVDDATNLDAASCGKLFADLASDLMHVPSFALAALPRL
jgi:hypothetical protein